MTASDLHTAARIEAMRSHTERKTVMREWLAARGYHLAVSALEFAERYHTGVRKDGVTPEFDHQLSIAEFLVPLAAFLRNPNIVLTTVFLHDVREDHNVTHDTIRGLFGVRVAVPVDALTNCFKGVRRPEAEVAAAITASPDATVVKLFDRIHNQSTMRGVIAPLRIAVKTEETRRWILPMLAAARRRFPDQERVYTHAESVLLDQLRMLEGDLVAA